MHRDSQSPWYAHSVSAISSLRALQPAPWAVGSAVYKNKFGKWIDMGATSSGQTPHKIHITVFGFENMFIDRLLVPGSDPDPGPALEYEEKVHD